MSLDTRGIDPQRLLPQSLEDRLLGWLGRTGGFTLLAGIAVLWAALVSWSAADPSLTHATTAEPRNFLGPLGAILSDLLFQTLGFAAVVALLAPIVWAVDLLRNARLENSRSKIGFYPIAILTIAGALSSYPVVSSWPLNHGFGGALGDGLFELCARIFQILNEDRADLAAGLALNAAALTVAAKSIGLDYEEVVQVLQDQADLFASKERSQRQWPGFKSLWPQKRAAGASAEDAASPYGAAAALATDPALDVPPHLWTTNRPAPAPFHANGYGQGYGDTPYVPVAAAQPVSGYPAPFAQVYPPAPYAGYPSMAPQAAPYMPFGGAADAASLMGEDDINRGHHFDQSTEEASHAIAARFAPGGAADPAFKKAAGAGPGAQAPMSKTPLKPGQKVGGLLGGMSFRKAEPEWKLPGLNLLKRPPLAKPGPEFTQTVMRGNARLLEDVLNDFGVKGEVKDIRPGPVVTLYELEPARGTKSSRVIGLADDIARSMSVTSVRASVVPGRNAIGLELPNVKREPVLLREILESEAYRASDAALPMALGKSIGGDPVVTDLARMPHLLVAGTTGSGKSVGVNAMIVSLLYKHSPAECRMLMIDPKMLELSVYNGIPHLLTPVVTDPHKAVAALNWAVSEMEERYKRMAALSVRNIDVFNNRVKNAKKRGEMLSRTVQTGFDATGQAVFESQKMDLEPLPHIVIVVDEFADLMIVAGKDVEGAIQRLAQMARAAGIHLIMATQRPSVDVITGTIKANFPTRISFKVTSKIDSRTILNDMGAEQLLGQGDMLFSTGAGQLIRVHGAFVADEEVEAIAEHLRLQGGGPRYIEGILDAPPAEASSGNGGREPSEGDLYDRAVAIVLRDRKASVSYVQRRLSIGYNRAADLIERMEREGLISPANATGKRDILVATGGSADAA